MRSCRRQRWIGEAGDDGDGGSCALSGRPCRQPASPPRTQGGARKVCARRTPAYGACRDRGPAHSRRRRAARSCGTPIGHRRRFSPSILVVGLPHRDWRRGPGRDGGRASAAARRAGRCHRPRLAAAHAQNREPVALARGRHPAPRLRLPQEHYAEDAQGDAAVAEHAAFPRRPRRRQRGCISRHGRHSSRI